MNTEILALLHHPALPTLLAAALMLFPLQRLYRRVGLHGAPALLVFASLLVPFLGLVLALAPLLLLRWPCFPDAPKTGKKEAERVRGREG